MPDTPRPAVLPAAEPAGPALEQPASFRPGDWWRSAWRHWRWNLVLSTAVAVFLTVMFGDGLWRNLVFSFCIGGTIQLLIELGRIGLSHLLLRRGVRRPALQMGWPGWWLMGPWVIMSALSGYVVGMLLAGWLLGLEVQMRLGSTRSLFLVLSITLAVSLVATYTMYTRSRMNELQAEREAAQRLATEHQLMLLQSQLEPHMLFNTLANLRVLIGMDALRAQSMLDHLIAFLRSTLSASRASAHPLQAEFDRLADYLALMAVRMGPRLQVQFDLPDTLRELPVPPLLLQPLVENCIKHGLEPKVAGGRIEVSAAQVDGQLRLQVRDTGVGLAGSEEVALIPAHPAPGPGIQTGHHADTQATGTGFGTSQVRQRLQAVYGAAARFSLRPADDAEGGTVATITLPWPATASTTDLTTNRIPT